MPYKFNPFTGTFDDSTTGPQGATGTVSAAGSGTAAAPGIAFASDLNTGIYNPSADNLAISTGGTGRLFVDASGNIGAGVSSPATASFGNTIRNKAPAGTGAAGYFAEGANSDTWFGIYSGTGTSDSAALIYPSTGSLRIATSTGVGVGGFTERMRLTSAGLLGLGTSSPVAFLHVSGSGASSCRLTDTQSYNFGTSGPTLDLTGNDSSGANTLFARLKGSPNNGNADRGFLDILTRVDGITTSTLQVGTGLAANVLIPNGRVGIGTSSPSQVLTAVGNIKIAGAQAGNVANLCLTRTDRSWTINNETDLRFRTSAGDTDSPATATVVFTGAGNVGIGTTSPGASLHVAGSITSAPTGSGLLAGINGSYGQAKLYGSSGSIIDFGASGADAKGRILFNNSDFAIQFHTDNGFGLGERARIDSSGRLLVGTSTPASSGQIGTVIANGNSGGLQLTVPPAGGGGGLAATATTGGGAKIYTHTGNVGSEVYTERVTIDSYVRLASGTGGIQFNGDTAAANALDDYEEGTWTPTVVGSSTAGTATYAARVGTYTKIGRQVTAHCSLDYSGGTGAGNLQVSGLPFTTSAQIFNAFPTLSGVTTTASTIPYAYTQLSVTLVEMAQYPIGGGTATTIAYDATGTIYFTLTYIAA
jgi:hypothetical protein